ncbi:MAG: hypothetical protein HYV26_24795 [Candidatus Hydrogenedentes bacterium]|nr:hypothetical protein [Candidatus Hydrogenedentota bacterium]
MSPKPSRGFQPRFFPLSFSPRERARRTVEDQWHLREERRCFTVAGLSMGRALSPGASIQVCFSHQLRIGHGDVIYFRRGHGLRVVHRCLACFGPIIVEKGDANWLPGWCFRRDVLGKVEFCAHPGLGRHAS